MRNYWTCLLLCLGVLLNSCGSSEPKLFVYSWAEFLNPEVIQRFEKLYGCQVILDTYDSNEALFAKLRIGASGYDVVFPSTYYVTIMARYDMLHEINFDRLPNLKYLDSERFPQGAKHSEWSVPYMISASIIAYRSDRVYNPEASWNIFLRSDLKDRMTLLNDSREVLGAALKTLGYSVNTHSAQEVEAAADRVILWKKNIAKFESEQYESGLASSEYLVVHAYGGPIVKLMGEQPLVKALLPKEGLVISADHMAIPKGSPNPDLAHEFINFLWDPEIAAMNMNRVGELSPNSEALKRVNDSLKNNPAFLLPKEVLERSEVIEDLGDAIHLYHRAWDRVKAAPVR